MSDAIQPVKLPCVMAGARETLTVEPIGRFGVAFKYNEDASVIARGDDLRRVRAILDHQIASWDAAQAGNAQPSTEQEPR